MRRLAWLAALATARAAPDVDTLLARAAELERWFNRTGPAPAVWTVSKSTDVPKPWREVHAGNLIKKVYRGSVGADLGGASVVVKTIAHGTHEKGGTLLMELLFLHALRGAPGVPDLFGAWFYAAWKPTTEFGDERVTYVVGDGGEPIARRKGPKPILVSAPFKARAASHPLQLARSLVACFASWATDWVQSDFTPEQFTMDTTGDVFLVDGPRAFAHSTLGGFAARAWRSKVLLANGTSQTCGKDEDCPRSRYKHSCHHQRACGAGARGSPEARGTCRDDRCLGLSEKTHVFDVANRPWLLPYPAKRATGAERDLLDGLVRKMSAEDPDDRPSFAAVLAAIDRFEKQAAVLPSVHHEPDVAALLRRAAALDAWWDKGTPPPAWTVSGPTQVHQPWRRIGEQANAKVVYRATVDRVLGGGAYGIEAVVVKRSQKSTDAGGGTLYLEMLYLEVLRGAPGVHRLYGAWRDGKHVTYVVGDCGESQRINHDLHDVDATPARWHPTLTLVDLCTGDPIGKGPPEYGTAPTILSEAFRRRAEAQPLQLARSLLACFRSWASTGHLQNLFKAEQFTMTYKGEVFMVDGPRLLANAPLGEAVLRNWEKKLGRSALETLQKRLLNAQRVKCETDDDCPPTKNYHSCRRPGSCEPGARGAPEARGKCLEGTCALLSEKTHVYDVANRPWLLPYIADRATGGDRAFLLALIRHASAEDPDDRPSFAELVAAIDRRVEGATVN